MITQLTTPRLTIRQFRPSDAGDLYEYLSDPEIYFFEPGEPLDRQQTGDRAAQMAASADFRAIELRSTPKVIGQLYFKRLDPPHLLTCELGYVVNPAYQRQGYGSEAASAVVLDALTSHGMHRIVAHCDPRNPASWRLLEKLGFRREGLLRQDVFFRRTPEGRPIWLDTCVYGLLASDVRGQM